jgi:carboxypeptidase T
MIQGRILSLSFSALLTLTSIHAGANALSSRFVQISALDKFERSALADLGLVIESVHSDSVWGFADEETLEQLALHHKKLMSNNDPQTARGGHGAFAMLDFPAQDTRFHNYSETTALLKKLQQQYPNISTLSSIGKTHEGRDIWAFHINTTPEALTSGLSQKPGMIYMGNHHAREHLSNEVPLMLTEYLLSNQKDPNIGRLIDTRDIWIIPMVNPDGVEYDISTGKYKMWRKNRRDNGDGTFGVDLNRNYGYQWGTGGSSKNPSNDTYMGTTPFSEPETQKIRDFIDQHLNLKVLVSYHTFSELILYPWGHSFDKIPKPDDIAVFEKMAKTMAGWNNYTPEQASSLYIASGDTTDWAYGTHGIFAFTFELTPKTLMSGGFYPGAGVIDKVFNDNLKPALYMLEAAGDPYQTVNVQENRFGVWEQLSKPFSLVFSPHMDWLCR